MIVNPRIRRWERLAQEKLTLKTAREYYQVFNRTEGKIPKTVHWYEEVLARLRVLSSLFRIFLPLVKVSFWGAW